MEKNKITKKKKKIMVFILRIKRINKDLLEASWLHKWGEGCIVWMKIMQVITEWAGLWKDPDLENEIMDPM